MASKSGLTESSTCLHTSAISRTIGAYPGKTRQSGVSWRPPPPRSSTARDSRPAKRDRYMYSEKSASYFDFAIVTIYRARKPQNLRQHAETCCPRKKSRQLIRCAIYASSFNCRIVSLIYLFPISNYLTIIIEVLDFCIPLYPHLSYSTHRCDSFIERNGERDLHPRYHWEFKRQHLKRRRAAVSRPAICYAYRSIRACEDERILISKRDD